MITALRSTGKQVRFNWIGCFFCSTLRYTATTCAESALRVLVNLTHEDLPWCRAVLDDGMSMPAIMHLVVTAQRERRLLEKCVDAEKGDCGHAENAARSLDRLCLALGLLTNLVQATPDARHIIGDTCAFSKLETTSQRVSNQITRFQC